jgi:hypothetical protein
VVEAQQKIINACTKRGKSSGTQVKIFSETEVKNTISLGYNLIFSSSDLFILADWTQSAGKVITNIKK